MKCLPLVTLCLFIFITAFGLSWSQNDAGYEMQFATYLGGHGFEINGGIAIDEEGNIFVAGSTTSDDFPVQNSIQEFQGGPFPGSDGFVSKFSRDGELLYSTFIGGSSVTVNIPLMT